MNTHSAARSFDTTRKIASVLTLLASFAGWPERVSAEEARAEGQVAAAASGLNPKRQSDGTSPHHPDWGWLVIGPSLVTGAACTSYGLLRDCASTDRSCSRGASLAIWGGVGIASIGSLIGMALLESHAPSRRAAGAALDLQLSADSRAAGSLLPSGALLRLVGPLYW